MLEKQPLMLLVITLALAGATACTDKAPARTSLPEDEKVLAEVDGSKITQYDLDHAAKKMFSESTAAQLGEDGKKRLLESLVQSRAMARKREAELTDAERAELDKDVAAHREELLVRQFLVKHTRPEGVSNEMVAKYYAEHPERFGGKVTRAYELIATQRELSAPERAKVIDALKAPGAQKDWPAWVATLQKKGLPLGYQRGQGTDAVLHPALQSLVNRLAPNQSSELTFVQGRAYVLRVTGETRQPPKALAEVSGEIRKTLMPVQLKKSVEQASSQVMKNAKVAYR